MTAASMCKGDQWIVVGVFVFVCAGLYISTITHKNQQCYLSGLGQFKDQEEGLFSVHGRVFC